MSEITLHSIEISMHGNIQMSFVMMNAKLDAVKISEKMRFENLMGIEFQKVKV